MARFSFLLLFCLITLVHISQAQSPAKDSSIYLRSYADMMLGRKYASHKQWSKAIEHYNKAIKLSQDSHEPWSQITCLREAARVYHERQEMDKTFDYLRKALNIAKAQQDKEAQRDIHLELSNAYQLIRDHEDALNNYREYCVLNDELISIAKSKQKAQSADTSHTQKQQLADTATKATVQQQASPIKPTTLPATTSKNKPINSTLWLAIAGVCLLAGGLWWFLARKKGGTMKVSTMGFKSNATTPLSGITAQMGQIIEKAFEQQDISLYFDVDKNLKDYQISINQQEPILTIYQEAISNIAKHAKASNVWVRLLKQGNKLCLEIQDNGKGFKTDKKENIGKGLSNMALKAKEIDSILDLKSMTGNGTDIKVSIPLNG